MAVNSLSNALAHLSGFDLFLAEVGCAVDAELFIIGKHFCAFLEEEWRVESCEECRFSDECRLEKHDLDGELHVVSPRLDLCVDLLLERDRDLWCLNFSSEEFRVGWADKACILFHPQLGHQL